MARIDQFVHSPEQFNQLIRLSKKKHLPIRTLAYLIDELTSHGLNQSALAAISEAERTASNEQYLNYLSQKRKICQFVERSPNVKKSILDPKTRKFLMAKKNVYYEGLHERKKLMVVFATLYNNFNISFPFLHGLLQGYGHSILYIKNPDRGMFLRGAEGFGSSIQEMATEIGTWAENREISEIRIMGLSSGGYASLQTAGLLAARAYLGFGITTDMRPESPLKIGRIAERIRDNAEAKLGLLDLSQEETMHNIGCAQIFFGERAAYDREQANNMRSLPNFSIAEVPDGTHAVLLQLVASGKLRCIFDDFVGTCEPGPSEIGHSKFEFLN